VVSDLKANLRGFPGNVETADPGMPSSRKQQRCQDSQERGFSRAVGADQSQDLALF
jgi:hypothetical protein